MSLDVYLEMEDVTIAAGSGIFIRRNGRTEEITREEWDRLYPGRKTVAVQPREDDRDVYRGNITHNLGRMAKEAGIYEALWRPEEVGITHARQLIEPLRDGLALLQSEPERFRPLNPANGWGDYDVLVHFVARYLAACQAYPSATVRVWW